MQCYFTQWLLILDTYFVHGSKVREHLQQYRLSCVDSYVVTGDVKSYLLKRGTPRHSGYLEGYEHATLVLDWHSDADPFTDKVHLANSWANNIDFYEAILVLAQSYPKSCFVIRGKNDEWLRVDALADIRNRLLSLPNVIVNTHYDRLHVSHELVEAADSIIGRHTSLADLALAADKPVILIDWFVNGSHCVDIWFGFSPYPVLAHSQGELFSMYDKVMRTGRIMNQDKQQKITREYANEYPGAGSPKDQVLSELEAMLTQTRNAQKL